MKITVITCFEEDKVLERELTEQLDTYAEESDNVLTKIDLTKYNLKFCVACDYCQNKNPGICCNNDGGNDIYRNYLSSDKIIIISPVKFGCFNSQIKNLIDRAQPLSLPLQAYKNKRTIMKPRYDKYPDLICVGVTDNTDKKEIDTFKSFIIDCNLAAFSKNVTVEVISNTHDLSFLKNLMKGKEF